MPTQSNETKRLTRQGGSESPTELTARGRADDMQDAPLVLLPSVSQCRSGVHTARNSGLTAIMFRNRFSRPSGREKHLLTEAQFLPRLKSWVSLRFRSEDYEQIINC